MLKVQPPALSPIDPHSSVFQRINTSLPSQPATMASLNEISAQKSMSPPPIPLSPPVKDRPSAAKRPKLALQIAPTDGRIYGKSSTGLSLSANPISPTSRNTFSNAFETPLSALVSPTSVESSCFSPRSPVDDLFSPSGSTRRTSFSSINSSAEPPFQQCISFTKPGSLQSILRSSAQSRRPLFTSRVTRQAIFPLNKKVSFASEIASEITTVNYTKSHYELLCEDESEPSPAESTNLKETKLSGLPKIRLNTNLPTSPESTEDLTPAARKRKKREWKWTIGLDEVEDDDDNEPCVNDTKHLEADAGRPQLLCGSAKQADR